MTGAVIWVTGLPASGRSTLARALAGALRERAVATCVLDSDEVRDALSPPVGHGEEDRAHFYRTLAGLAALVARQGLAVIVPATANRAAYRDEARERADRFVEVHVDTAVEECERRDPKGLYRAARAGRIAALPGIAAPYEPPERPDVVARGGADDAAIAQVVGLVTEERPPWRTP